NTLLSKDCGAIKQLELMKTLQEKWTDQSVSITVYYKTEEISNIKEWLKQNYNNSVKTVSFLRHKNHGFKQAPYQEITQEEYLEKKKNIKPFKQIEKVIGGELSGIECLNGACPIK
ncbi:MAG: hypothetical protein AABY22_36080, partial [Nanoarchaeota archaeon]